MKSKTKYKAVNACKYSIRWAWIIGFGYQRFVIPVNSPLFVKVVENYFLPFCEIQAVQDFRREQKSPGE